MKLKNFFSLTASLCLFASLLLSVGCGGGEGGADSAAKIAELEAKAAQGDALSAYQAGELLANEAGENSEKRVRALKWFKIAQKLGNEQASMGITTMESTMTGDEIMDATRAAENFKAAGQ